MPPKFSEASFAVDRDRLQQAVSKATAHLLAQRNAAGHWTGELSASALSTATAIVALTLSARHCAVEDARVLPLITKGLTWLVHHQNADGGWGDTTLSRSNISTTTLVWAAFGVNGDRLRLHAATLEKAEAWLRDRAGSLDPVCLARKIIARYGDDRTFSVPILTMCALSGRFGSGAKAWEHVIPLPFELAAFPQSWFAALRLPVVSYALPALIAIGYAHHFHAPAAGGWNRVRSAVKDRVFRVLDSIQPENGGFLEATPLTSFVVMSLAASGEAAHPVVKRGVEFLIRSAQPDGSWAIDTNLATWVTSLSVHALAGEPAATTDQYRSTQMGGHTGFSSDLCSSASICVFSPSDRAAVKAWLLNQQYREVHPYTGAAPGGWAWTDLPGGVPDADDTPGALLALRTLDGEQPERATSEAAKLGVGWLLDLQNRDGGIPTFCKGWGRLPFDHSSADLTAHSLRAWAAWRSFLPPELQARVDVATDRAIQFLETIQEDCGAWAPLWFGNETEADESNRVYGTSRVLLALADTQRARASAELAAKWLIQVQKPDGGWSGGERAGASSTEETALALEALAAFCQSRSKPAADIQSALARGTSWLMRRVNDGSWTTPSPIGFYFAKLWYFEQLYPVIYTVAALRRVNELAGFKQG